MVQLTESQKNSLEELLTGLTNTLVVENRGTSLPHAAVRREIGNLQRVLGNSGLTFGSRATLTLFRSYYEKVLRQVSPTDPNMNVLDRPAINAAHEIIREIESVQIPENASAALAVL